MCIPELRNKMNKAYRNIVVVSSHALPKKKDTYYNHSFSRTESRKTQSVESESPMTVALPTAYIENIVKIAGGHLRGKVL